MFRTNAGERDSIRIRGAKEWNLRLRSNASNVKPASTPNIRFCSQCGELAPFALNAGPFSVEIQEVPSEALRTQALSVLKSWFPEMETIRTDRIISSGRSILVNGVDEESADRLLRALKPMKINGRILELRGGDWWKLLWNPGLILSVPGLVATWTLGGAAAILSFMVAVAAPVIGAVLERSRRQPLVRQETLRYLSGEWGRLAREYSEIVRLLSPEDLAVLKSIAGRVLDLQKQLASRSLAAAAAGGEKGEFYNRLTDAMRTAVQIGSRIAVQGTNENVHLREDLVSIDNLLDETRIWYTNLETEDGKQVPQLTAELGEISAGIDRIVREVRHASDQRVTTVTRSQLME